MREADLKSAPLDINLVKREIAFKTAIFSRRLRARFAERVGEGGHTESRWSALFHLAREEDGLIQTELAERMAIQGPTLVRLLDALEEQGLVRRCSTPEDRRAKRVFIQPAGEALVANLDVIASQLRSEAFAGNTEEELRITLRVLDRIAAAVGTAEA